MKKKIKNCYFSIASTEGTGGTKNSGGEFGDS
jgi:hypothetical protein